MAEEENNQPKKSRGILKILMFVFGGLILIGAGLGAGFLMFGSSQPDPSEEIEKIIERKMVEAEEKKAAEEGSLGTFILIGLNCFFPNISIFFFIFFFIFIISLLSIKIFSV